LAKSRNIPKLTLTIKIFSGAFTENYSTIKDTDP